MPLVKPYKFIVQKNPDVELLLDEVKRLREIIEENTLSGVLEIRSDYVILDKGYGVQFGSNGPRIVSDSGVPIRTDLPDGSLYLRSDPPDSSNATYVSVSGIWTAL